jgi:hypothetical protein
MKKNSEYFSLSLSFETVHFFRAFTNIEKLILSYLLDKVLSHIVCYGWFCEFWKEKRSKRFRWLKEFCWQNGTNNRKSKVYACAHGTFLNFNVKNTPEIYILISSFYRWSTQKGIFAREGQIQVDLHRYMSTSLRERMRLICHLLPPHRPHNFNNKLNNLKTVQRHLQCRLLGNNRKPTFKLYALNFIILSTIRNLPAFDYTQLTKRISCLRRQMVKMLEIEVPGMSKFHKWFHSIVDMKLSGKSILFLKRGEVDPFSWKFEFNSWFIITYNEAFNLVFQENSGNTMKLLCLHLFQRRLQTRWMTFHIHICSVLCECVVENRRTRKENWRIGCFFGETSSTIGYHDQKATRTHINLFYDGSVL